MKRNFPYFYHLHHSLHPGDIPFWLSLAAEYGDPVLELGCGTGRVLSSLAEAGFEVFGLDHDPEMLSFLRNNLSPRLKTRIHIFLADLSAFHLSIEFPLIIMPCNTLSTLTKDTRAACLARVSQHLSKDGLFAASLPNPVAFQELPEFGEPELEETLADPVDGTPILVSSEWKRTAERFVVNWHYDRILAGGSKERLSVAMSHDLALRNDYLKELQSAGLQEVSSFGSFLRSRYRPDSPDLILTACKQKDV